MKARVALIAAKVLFIWIPLVLVCLVTIVMIGLKIYLTPDRVEKLIVSNFNEMSNGEISLNVKSFSPYGGFEIDNILIRNGEEFNRSTFVAIEKLVLKYGFFSLFAGNVHFDEIGIYKPRIYLEEKNGAWNAARLMKPSEKKPEPEKKEEKKKEDEGPPSKEVNLPISVEFLFKFILDDFRMYVKGGTFNAAVEGLTYTMDIWVPPFKKIPKSLEAVSLLERMKIVLNPEEEMQVSFYSQDADVTPPLILTWKLLFSKTEANKPEFKSLLKFGTYRTPVRFKQAHLAPLNFMVSYDIFYDPTSDFLRVNNFGVTFLNRRWLFLAGSVKDVTTAPVVDIKMEESAIVLDDLYPYFLALTHDYATRFSGVISLYPLSVKGTPDRMDINGEVNFTYVYFKNPAAEATIPLLKLGYAVNKLKDDMKISSRLSIPSFMYTLNKNKSGANGLDVGIDVMAYSGFQAIEINNISMRMYNPLDGTSALDMRMTGNVNLAAGTSGAIRIPKFTFMKEPLMAMLPNNIKKSLKGLPFKKPVDMALDLRFAMNQDATNAQLGMLVLVPDFDVTDLRIDADIAMRNQNKFAAINRFTITSPEKSLTVSANGWVDISAPPMKDSDIRLAIRLDAPQEKPVFGPWKLSGTAQVNAFVKGDLKSGKAFGSVKIDKLFVKNNEAKLTVNDVNMDFPFEYYFTPRYSGESRLLVDKTDVMESDYFQDKPNFTISSIAAKHPSRELPFEYLKDFSANMTFRENTFLISNLKAYVLDGSLYGRTIMFNLADMKPANMEYKLTLEITNVDLGKLDEFDPEKKTRDAELSLNANFAGKVGNIKKEILAQGSINIYKIGASFANRLMKGLSREKGESKLGIAQFPVDNSMSVKGFDFNLGTGLVYTTVAFSRGAIGYLFGVKDEKVEFDRMPIQEYIRKVREEK
ncbi:MAG: hypothetical protein EPN93_01230 [Spirochaetes bacterium]|nr:MAG: hypothetical protein EPN93_01230 [Spirochaetota bacterium]